MIRRQKGKTQTAKGKNETASGEVVHLHHGGTNHFAVIFFRRIIISADAGCLLPFAFYPLIS